MQSVLLDIQRVVLIALMSMNVTMIIGVALIHPNVKTPMVVSHVPVTIIIMELNANLQNAQLSIPAMLIKKTV